MAMAPAACHPDGKTGFVQIDLITGNSVLSRESSSVSSLKTGLNMR